jgi:hypothetical protein
MCEQVRWLAIGCNAITTQWGFGAESAELNQPRAAPVVKQGETSRLLSAEIYIGQK